MFIAGIGSSVRPPLGGPCPSVFQANNNGCLHFKEHMALLRRAEHPTTRAINMALLTEGGRRVRSLLSATIDFVPRPLYACPPQRLD